MALKETQSERGGLTVLAPKSATYREDRLGQRSSSKTGVWKKTQAAAGED